MDVILLLLAGQKAGLTVALNLGGHGLASGSALLESAVPLLFNVFAGHFLFEVAGVERGHSVQFSVPYPPMFSTFLPLLHLGVNFLTAAAGKVHKLFINVLQLDKHVLAALILVFKPDIKPAFLQLIGQCLPVHFSECFLVLVNGSRVIGVPIPFFISRSINNKNMAVKLCIKVPGGSMIEFCGNYVSVFKAFFPRRIMRVVRLDILHDHQHGRIMGLLELLCCRPAGCKGHGYRFRSG